jgi:hypothetical protein
LLPHRDRHLTAGTVFEKHRLPDVETLEPRMLPVSERTTTA